MFDPWHWLTLACEDCEEDVRAENTTAISVGFCSSGSSCKKCETYGGEVRIVTICRVHGEKDNDIASSTLFKFIMKRDIERLVKQGICYVKNPKEDEVE